MHNKKAIRAAVVIAFGVGCYYLGYRHGTSRMFAAYGEVATAEAISYLVETDIQKWDSQD